MNSTTKAKVTCGGCGRDYGHESRPIDGLYHCGGCAGLIGRCTENVLQGIISFAWEQGITRDEDMMYVDVDITDSIGDRRFHGWINSRTRNLVQVG